ADIGIGVTAGRSASGVVLSQPALPPPQPIDLPAEGAAAYADWGVTVRVSRGPRETAWTWRCTLPAESGELALRGRRPGDRVSTPAGTRKVQDILVDAKVPRFARNGVPVLCCMREPVAVLGLAGPNAVAHGLVVDVEPMEGGWWSLVRRRASS
ncbi:MAG: tRNA lysidine(34) synthetase TilS, partial [Trueperaceae bacterium]